LPEPAARLSALLTIAPPEAAQKVAAGFPTLFEDAVAAALRWRSWRISSMERTVAKVVPLFRQMTSKRAVESLTSHQPQRRFSMMPSRSIAAVFLLSSVLTAQSIDAGKVGIVHVYREDRLLIGTSLSVDGNDIVSLTPHKSATFYVSPGYHELTMRWGEISPTASFKAEPGKDYFFKMDYEHVASATSLRDLRLSLSLQPNGDADQLREAKIDQSKLMDILEQSNPRGLEPAHSATCVSNTQATE
jgi:hypothetical protein